MLQPLILLIVLIFLNAVFASAEIAVISVNEAKLRRLSSEGDVRAGRLLSLTEQPARFLATIQVAITVAGLLQSAFAAENFADPLVTALVRAGVTIPEAVLKGVSIVVITLILAYFNLVFGELVPKRLAMKRSEAMALGMAGMLCGVSRVFAPVVWLLTSSTNLILRLLGINPEEEDEQVTEEEIRLLLSESNEQGHIQKEEKEIIQNVFEFNDISVEEICTHRREVVMLSMKESEQEWEKIIFENRHTFYPVCKESTDEILAVLDTRDYFRLEDRSRDNLMRFAADEPFFVPETMRANVLFREMKKRRNYFAVIFDEYGSLSGIITLHDLVESLVGVISEEDDPEEEETVLTLEEGAWRVHGSALLREVSEATGTALEEGDYDTFGGYICGVLGRIPQDGETFTCRVGQLEIEVREVRDHRIGTTVVRKSAPVQH